MSSPVAVPMSWNDPSLNVQPEWQPAQPARPLNSAKPRFAAAVTAPPSPAAHRSNGASPDTIERS